MERPTGFEPATSSLGSPLWPSHGVSLPLPPPHLSCSTTPADEGPGYRVLTRCGHRLGHRGARVMPERGSAPEDRPAGLALRAVLSRVGKGADMADGNRIAGGYTKEVHCGRCQGLRWVRVDVPEPYTCQRCR